MNVMGTECAGASSGTSHSCFPVFDSKARKRLSVVAPMKISPLAVAMLPPRFSAPVRSIPFDFSDSTNPSGTCHAMSPVLTFTA